MDCHEAMMSSLPLSGAWPGCVHVTTPSGAHSSSIACNHSYRRLQPEAVEALTSAIACERGTQRQRTHAAYALHVHTKGTVGAAAGAGRACVHRACTESEESMHALCMRMRYRSHLQVGVAEGAVELVVGLEDGELRVDAERGQLVSQPRRLLIPLRLHRQAQERLEVLSSGQGTGSWLLRCAAPQERASREGSGVWRSGEAFRREEQQREHGVRLHQGQV